MRLQSAEEETRGTRAGRRHSAIQMRSFSDATSGPDAPVPSGSSVRNWTWSNIVQKRRKRTSLIQEGRSQPLVTRIWIRVSSKEVIGKIGTPAHRGCNDDGLARLKAVDARVDVNGVSAEDGQQAHVQLVHPACNPRETHLEVTV